MLKRDLFFPKSDIGKKDHYQHQTIHYRSTSKQILKINIHSVSSFNFIAKIKEIIPQKRLVVNKKRVSSVVFTTPKPDAISKAPNQPAARFVSNSDKTLSLDFVKTLVNYDTS